MAFPNFPNVRDIFKSLKLESAYKWFAQDLPNWINNSLATQGDMTLSTKGKGIVVTNAAGTITKRLRLNDGGTGIIIEDV